MVNERGAADCRSGSLLPVDLGDDGVDPCGFLDDIAQVGKFVHVAHFKWSFTQASFIHLILHTLLYIRAATKQAPESSTGQSHCEMLDRRHAYIVLTTKPKNVIRLKPQRSADLWSLLSGNHYKARVFGLQPEHGHFQNKCVKKGRGSKTLQAFAQMRVTSNRNQQQL
jgi:hypothetical protein